MEKDFSDGSKMVKKYRVPILFWFYLQVCLTSEMHAMAKIVQDLESQLARAEEENVGLNKSLEELDEQHQNAIGL
jgi:hypothetical protein